MSKSSTQKWVKYIHKPWFTISLILIGLACCAAGFLLLAAYFTNQSVTYLQRGEFSTAQAYAQQTQPIVHIFNLASFGLVPDLVVWEAALQLPTQASTLAVDTAQILQTSLAGNPSTSIETLSSPLQDISDTLAIIQQNLPKTYVLQKKVPSSYVELIPSVTKALADSQVFISSVSQGKQTWVVILQNSEEVRATGGFPGSYVLLNFDNGTLQEIVVEDIYDADGQFTGHVAAPPGIKEYTSGDKGLRLPDANWWPDFPKSAQTMLQFFALGEKNNIAGLVAVNLDAAKAVLSVTGPLLLPDYNVEVSQENIGEVLRTERSEFFPGSIQKKHLLQLTVTQLKQKISELSATRQQELVQALKTEISKKEIQFFSTRPELQEIFSRYSVSGELNTVTIADQRVIYECNCKPIEIALVESNVGINKVNRYVTRQNQLEFDQQTIALTTIFSNNAAPLSSTELSALVTKPVEAQPRNGNGYLNYYRLLISPEFTVQSIKVGSTNLSSWDEEKITTISGTELLQIGVLIGIPERSTNTVTFVLKKNDITTPNALVLFKQSGIPPSQYKISTPTSSQEFTLNQDTIIKL